MVHLADVGLQAGSRLGVRAGFVNFIIRVLSYIVLLNWK